MGRFDTHGGYFAPQDYFRVDTGGSHDENPNGGVQVGVDEQGIPNLLEEGEPVYDDYVYSDNIVSDKEILAKHSLPTRYAGMLYSKIADSFVDEAAERPNDPISNNGLNALLVRLADAQEEQKQIEAQRELEEELAQLSPEELAQVEQALAMQEQQAAAGEQMAAPQGVPQEAMAEQQMVPEEPLAQEQIMQQQVPVMACGGTLLRRFDAGGPKKQNWFTRATLGAAVADNPAVATSVGLEKNPNTGEVIQVPDTEGALQLQENLAKLSEIPLGIVGGEVLSGLAAMRTSKAAKSAAKAASGLTKGEKIRRGIETAIGFGIPLTYGPMMYRASGRPSFGNIVNSYREEPSDFDTFDADSVFYPVIPVPIDTTAVADTTQANQRALGGPVNKFGGETGSQLFRFKPIAPQRPVAPDVVKLSERGLEFYPSAYTGTRWLIPSSIGWESNPDKIDRLAKEATPGTWEWAQAIGRNNPFSATGVNLDGVSSGANTGNGAVVDAGAGTDANTHAIPLPKPLSTSSRYAGPLTAAALGIYNALQKPTRFTMPHYVPTIPEGRMHLYNPSFNPLDVNLAVNSINASGAGTMYGLRNSGLGPSTAQAMIAVDNNIGKNIGNAQTQAWDANNQRRNAVLAAMNQNGSALGQFDYGVARNAASLLNDMRLRNAQNDLMLQRLNDASETQQYAAVQNQIDQVAQALSAIGRENLTFNQINSNTALPYNVWNNGASYYAPTGIQPSNPYADLAYNAKTKEVYNTKTGAVVAKNVG